MSASEVRSFLQRHQLLARKDLGQNFLCDAALADRLVDLAGVGTGDAVVEIGTGLGVLTRALAARASRVVTLEIDAGIVRALRAEDLLPPNTVLLHADALRVDLPALVRDLPAPVRLVANLPYAVSAPLLRRILELRSLLRDWSVMLQREVAARLLAGPGSRDWGSLAVLHRLCVQAKRELLLEPGCFFPRPAVRSAFVRMRPLEAPAVAAEELPRVERVVRAAFSQRRKTLANALRGGLEPAPDPARLAAALAAEGLDPGVRAERLPARVFVGLARALDAGEAP